MAAFYICKDFYKPQRPCIYFPWMDSEFRRLCQVLWGQQTPFSSSYFMIPEALWQDGWGKKKRERNRVRKNCSFYLLSITWFKWDHGYISSSQNRYWLYNFFLIHSVNIYKPSCYTWESGDILVKELESLSPMSFRSRWLC